MCSNQEVLISDGILKTENGDMSCRLANAGWLVDNGCATLPEGIDISTCCGNLLFVFILKLS